MSARRIDMHRIQEVIRLHRLGRSRRVIARQLRMGRNTIRSYQEQLKKAGLLEGSADDLPAIEAVQAVIAEEFPPPVTSTQSSLKPWKTKIEEMHEAGNGPTAIHDHLRLHISDYSGIFPRSNVFAVA